MLSENVHPVTFVWVGDQRQPLARPKWAAPVREKGRQQTTIVFAGHRSASRRNDGSEEDLTISTETPIASRQNPFSNCRCVRNSGAFLWCWSNRTRQVLAACSRPLDQGFRSPEIQVHVPGRESPRYSDDDVRLDNSTRSSYHSHWLQANRIYSQLVSK